ncbi:type II toxin-antitoxin system HicA family toxin [Azohydromonas sediminis]|uniref:type II toxin-antitoxin system HicA family toxin n=1 Tax=Azohydromonas sediminis TaxID=2259674 RepID=UPI001B3577C3|nr:type II toxin-antitoxin system HicA family toxin [Azohydromonas sediminis]
MALDVLGYTITRQTGSHLRVTTESNGRHHEVIPNHSPIKIGTWQSILRSVAMHHGLTVAQLLARLDL